MTADPTILFIGILVATFVSEDLTCVAAGLMVASGQADLMLALTACFVGIYVGDLGLWGLGRLTGYGLLRWPTLERRLPQARLEELGTWLDRHCARTVLVSRFLPGTRLPLYLAAGLLGRNTGRFVFWAFVAALFWTPLLVLSVALLGEPFAESLRSWLGVRGLAVFGGALGAYAILRLIRSLLSPMGRAQWAARVARVWRWEFWPSWLFYVPLVPWLAILSVRYRSLTIWMAANPGIPLGGVVGESKFAILQQLQPEAVIPAALLLPGPLAERLPRFHALHADLGGRYPLILKPDASQRGVGVSKIDDAVDAEKYLQKHPEPVLLQTYHPGPHEVGIFVYRLPGEPRFRIFSVTDKVFPFVVGDGVSSLEELIWRHPRYRMQARLFLSRNQADANQVLELGQTFRLSLTGNHSQGTLFRDGGHLLTPELDAAVNDILRPFTDFFIGRFDIRYRSIEELKAGRELGVVELNGVTSESTNLYDPTWSLLRAYVTLFRQWSLLYSIGDANRRRGANVPSLGELFRAIHS